MTTVYLEADGNRYSCVAKGHATGDERVCAAISTLMYTAAGYLVNAPSEEVLEQRLDPGDAALEWRGNRTCWDVLKIGFLQLAHSYPRLVKCEVREIK